MPTACLPDDRHGADLGPLPGDVQLIAWDADGAPPAEFARTDFWVPPYGAPPPPADVLRTAASLRVVQLLSAGVEPWLGQVPPGVTLCSGRGIHGGSTAELAIAGLLSAWRELPRFQAAQREHRWAAPSGGRSLDGARVLVLGAGDIGRRVGAVLRLLDAEVTSVARRPRQDVRTLDELPDLLPQQDAVVVAVPLTPQTHHLVDAAFLAALPDGAVLVNVARGGIVDTDALLAEARSGRLRAFLDVTDPEPLPAEHELWQLPNVQITPHVGGGTLGWERRAYRLAGEQLRRFLTGAPLQNVVEAGY
jgi:phosphoglycerate dehydrogenase-like enzyme